MPPDALAVRQSLMGSHCVGRVPRLVRGASPLGEASGVETPCSARWLTND